ncbi:MAG: threonine aldolase [Kribbellaceae bacterium]|jgi:threonine aldolase|nr:threonine aldolase [Kribbellaceae bacterium]
MIEMRSDTFTLPTEEMLSAMTAAALGDDVYGEDPTVNQLEELAATTVGKPAACLMPSGTMANLAALLAHVPRGGKVLVGSESDIYLYEAGGASVCGGIMYDPIPTQPDGTLGLDDLAAGFPLDPDDSQFALPGLICVENTHNRMGGRVLDDTYLAQLKRFAAARGVPVHMDGARIFNAAVASGVGAESIAGHADSVQFCLSKGLSAPIGSILAGDAGFIEKARRIRKMLGGGMRQAGIFAAAGLVALTTMTDRLAEDHALALQLAEGLADLDTIDVNPAEVTTNIVLFRLKPGTMDVPDFLQAASRHGLSLTEFGHNRIRAVTHRGLTPTDISDALTIVAATSRRQLNL